LVQAAAPGQVWQSVSDATLDSQRGGFFFGGGLDVSFGITRSVFINGELVTETVLNISRINDITPAWAARLREELQSITLVQNGPGNTFVAGTASTSIPPPAATSSGAPNSTFSSAAGSTGSSNANTPSTTSTNPTTAPLPTSVAVTSAIGGVATGTVIQNTLNNQQILHQTIINATSNGLGMLRLSSLHNTLSEAIRQSVGVQ
jgi:hypothetical protein